MKKEIEVFLRRADGFIKDAQEDLKREDYDLAMFHVEQACQLILKAKLLDLTGYFEKTHSLRRLIEELSEIFLHEKLMEFRRENWSVLRNLEFAYLSSRYYPEDFQKEEVEEALKVYKNLRDLLWG
ncbi:MAG: HEPN domain-containing protein [Archaeoglobaceae archaeon]|nr:HEPN domain-containing protein [Archaeoglobaceae archaeon]MDW8118023.1 HEPN domain-containing protein [Archaeoglobaceae archaeon]